MFVTLPPSAIQPVLCGREGELTLASLAVWEVYGVNTATMPLGIIFLKANKVYDFLCNNIIILVHFYQWFS